jgi:signal transduction histidine kinase
MSPLGTVIICWAAIYGYVCTYYCLLYLRRRSEPEYLLFGLLSGTFTVYCLGNAMLVDSKGLPSGTTATRVLWVAVLLTTPLFLRLCQALVGNRSRLPWLAYGWTALGLLWLSLGLLVSPKLASPAFDWRVAWAPAYPEPEFTWLGHLWFVAAWLQTGAGMALLFRSARSDRDARIMLVGATPILFAGAHDILVRQFGLQSYYLLEHTALLPMMAMCYVLLNRFARNKEALSRRTEELTRSTEELRHFQRKLVRKEQLAAVGQLSAVVAHEVRNPLAVIKNAVSGLRRSNLGATDRQTLLDILDEEIDRLKRLVQDLLAYAQPVTPQKANVPLEPLLREGIEHAYEANPDAKRPELRWDLELGPSTVGGDAHLLQQAITNVADNAMQAMPGGGVLSIQTKPAALGDREAVTILIGDTGEGMDATAREKALNPFFTTRATGTGLGLAIVERVVRGHGGELDIQSQHGAGTTVRITLPVQGPVEDAIPPGRSPDARETPA